MGHLQITKGILIKLIMAIVISITVLPCRAQVNAEQVTAIGRNVLSMDDYMLAIHYFNMAIKAKDYLAEPYFLRALAKMKLDDFGGAEADATTAIARSKYLLEAYKLRGFVRLQQNKDSLAVEDFEYGLSQNPKDKEILFYKAVAELNLKRYDTAEESLTALIAANPQFYEAVTARAQLRLEKGDTLGALDDFEETLRISKAQEYPYAMQAQIYAQRQEWAKAVEAMNEVVRLYPDQPDLYINRAYMRYMNDDYQGAMNDYNETLHLDPYNEAALFNRGLLRYEVLELDGAAKDFSKVLDLDSHNFHALFNRALIYLQTKNYAKADPDLRRIIKEYPRYYPAYQALAQCRYELGDVKGAYKFSNQADELVRKYVENPRKNPLDRPRIAEASNSKGHRESENVKANDKDVDIMDRFNQLVTTEVTPQTSLSFNDKYKGRVQDRETSIAPEPLFLLSMAKPQESLKAVSSYFRELGELNNKNFIQEKIYLKEDDSPMTEEQIGDAFQLVERYSNAISSSKPRAVDYIARGVLYTMLRNYESALQDFDSALDLMPDYTVALMGKGYATAMMMKGNKDISPENVINIYDKALTRNPTLVYAWFNKGNILYDCGDYRNASECFSKAIELNPELGQAFYNRGLSLMQQGKRDEAFADFSKAGELGVLQGYRVMKSLR